MKSLDPRVNRLPVIEPSAGIHAKAPLDQFGTYEVFVQPKEGKLFQHEGAVHAPNIEMAYVLAKETFTRRFTCVSLYVTDTRDVYVSPLSDNTINAYDLIEAPQITSGEQFNFEIYHLMKRGKQHIRAGEVYAATPHQAMYEAKELLGAGKIVYNVWAILSKNIRFTSDEEKDLWITLPDKKFRDAADYKGGDKLKEFLDRTQV